jgi:hypothetical protein
MQRTPTIGAMFLTPIKENDSEPNSPPLLKREISIINPINKNFISTEDYFHKKAKNLNNSLRDLIRNAHYSVYKKVSNCIIIGTSDLFVVLTKVINFKASDAEQSIKCLLNDESILESSLSWKVTNICENRNNQWHVLVNQGDPLAIDNWALTLPFPVKDVLVKCFSFDNIKSLLNKIGMSETIFDSINSCFTEISFGMKEFIAIMINYEMLLTEKITEDEFYKFFTKATMEEKKVITYPYGESIDKEFINTKIKDQIIGMINIFTGKPGDCKVWGRKAALYGLAFKKDEEFNNFKQLPEILNKMLEKCKLVMLEKNNEIMKTWTYLKENNAIITETSGDDKIWAQNVVKIANTYEQYMAIYEKEPSLSDDEIKERHSKFTKDELKDMKPSVTISINGMLIMLIGNLKISEMMDMTKKLFNGETSALQKLIENISDFPNRMIELYKEEFVVAGNNNLGKIVNLVMQAL